ncbi:hypothetical protein [Thermomonas sp.]|uniref:hypothetical protein n=1 Tax=Thermomonas sp. TaxID=1971895 RepID=UPI00261FDBFD|nr:hypothetical protein [Thermomonas sp.]
MLHGLADHRQPIRAANRRIEVAPAFPCGEAIELEVPDVVLDVIPDRHPQGQAQGIGHRRGQRDRCRRIQNCPDFLDALLACVFDAGTNRLVDAPTIGQRHSQPIECLSNESETRLRTTFNSATQHAKGIAERGRRLAGDIHPVHDMHDEKRTHRKKALEIGQEDASDAEVTGRSPGQQQPPCLSRTHASSRIARGSWTL